MPYERSLDIEQRLNAVLRLIGTGKYSTPALAEELKVSIPTISRCVTALRERGHDIRAERQSNAWRYYLAARKSRAHDSKSKTRRIKPGAHREELG